MMSTTFIDRSIILYQVGKSIYRLRHNQQKAKKAAEQQIEEKYHFFLIQGMPGLGKTELLKHLTTYYASPNNSCIPESARSFCKFTGTSCSEDHQEIPCVYVDFGLYVIEGDSERSFVLILQSILESLKNSKSATSAIFVEAIDSFLNLVADYFQEFERLQPDQRIQNTNSIADRFTTIINDITNSHQPVIILVDNVDKFRCRIKSENQTYSDTLRLFEDHILVTLKLNQHFIVAMTSRRTVPWKSPAIRQHVDTHQIMAFSTEDMKKQIDIHDDELARLLQRFTGGHPYANRLLKNHLSKDVQTKADLQEWIIQNGGDLILALKNNVVTQYLLHSTSGVAESTILDVCLKISVTRILEINLFYELLTSDFAPRKFHYGKSSQYNNLLEEITHTGLLKYNSDKQVFVVDPIIRQIMVEYYRFYYHDDFKSIVENVVVKKFYDWIQNNQNDVHVYIVEWLYQQACLYTHTNLGASPDLTLKFLQEALRGITPSNTNWTKLQEALEVERTSDFGNIVDLTGLIEDIKNRERI